METVSFCTFFTELGQPKLSISSILRSVIFRNLATSSSCTAAASSFISAEERKILRGRPGISFSVSLLSSKRLSSSQTLMIAGGKGNGKDGFDVSVTPSDSTKPNTLWLLCPFLPPNSPEKVLSMTISAGSKLSALLLAMNFNLLWSSSGGPPLLSLISRDLFSEVGFESSSTSILSDSSSSSSFWASCFAYSNGGEWIVESKLTKLSWLSTKQMPFIFLLISLLSPLIIPSAMSLDSKILHRVACPPTAFTSSSVINCFPNAITFTMNVWSPTSRGIWIEGMSMEVNRCPFLVFFEAFANEIHPSISTGSSLNSSTIGSPSLSISWMLIPFSSEPISALSSPIISSPRKSSFNPETSMFGRITIVNFNKLKVDSPWTCKSKLWCISLPPIGTSLIWTGMLESKTSPVASTSTPRLLIKSDSGPWPARSVQISASVGAVRFPNLSMQAKRMKGIDSPFFTLMSDVKQVKLWGLPGEILNLTTLDTASKVPLDVGRSTWKEKSKATKSLAFSALSTAAEDFGLKAHSCEAICLTPPEKI